MIVELHGLEVFEDDGALPEEARDGQTFVVDVELEVDEPAGDRIEDALDYREVATTVEAVSGGHRFQLIESLAGAIADALVERLPARRVRVRVRKPHPGDIPAQWSAATAERPGPATLAE